MKKTIATLTLTALAVMTVGPALTVATTVTTNLERDITGGDEPTVMVSWIANYDLNPSRYLDDNTALTGSQILPSGNFEGHRTISMCAIVTSPYGLSYIDNVFTDVFYPVDIDLGEFHQKLPNQTGEGCGEWMQQDKLTRLNKQDGINLFCNLVKDNNYKLPNFVSPYSYANICGQDGYLEKDTAAVWCGEKQISYEDPSGDYKVNTIAYDKGGVTKTHEHGFGYTPVAAFQTDFSLINYGKIRQGFEKIIQGNTVFGDALATVRNTGNTRLKIGLVQDDMGLGTTSGIYNVRYKAKIGSSTLWPDWKWPYVHYYLDKQLDLSERNQMDFSIEVIKFPTHTGTDQYSGDMTLSAISEPHLLTCPQ